MDVELYRNKADYVFSSEEGDTLGRFSVKSSQDFCKVFGAIDRILCTGAVEPSKAQELRARAYEEIVIASSLTVGKTGQITRGRVINNVKSSTRIYGLPFDKVALGMCIDGLDGKFLG